MQLRDPNLPNVPTVPPDPLWQWSAIGVISMMLAKRMIEWFASFGSWIVKKDSEEVRINEKLIDYQQQTINQLIQLEIMRLGGKVES